MATTEKNCWRPTDPSAERLGLLQSGWRCRRRGKTSSPFRITRNSSQPHSSSMPTLRLSPPKIRAPSSIPLRATPRNPSSMRPVATALLSCAAMVRQSRRWSTESLMRSSTSYKHCRKRSARLKACWPTLKPCE